MNHFRCFATKLTGALGLSLVIMSMILAPPLMIADDGSHLGPIEEMPECNVSCGAQPPGNCAMGTCKDTPECIETYCSESVRIPMTCVCAK
jgi:hypothetical protein